MGRHLSEFQLGQICAWRDQKQPLSFGEIGKKLNRRTAVVRRAYQRVKERGSSKRKVGSGRKRETTPREDRRIKYYVRQNPFATNEQIQDDLNLNTAAYRVGQRCIELGLNSYWSVSKPHISDKNIRKRLKYAKTHIKWSIDRWRKTRKKI